MAIGESSAPTRHNIVMSTSVRTTLAALLLSLLASCRLQSSSPPTWGEGDPPELIHYLAVCLGGSTTLSCDNPGQGTVIRYEYRVSVDKEVDFVEWDPIARGWGTYDVAKKEDEKGWELTYNSPFAADALSLPEGENVIENYARPVGQTGPWVLHRITFRKSLNNLGEPVFNFENWTVTRHWVAEEDLPFKRVTLEDGYPGYVSKDLTIPIYPPQSYCLAPGASWPLGEEPVEADDNPPVTPPALYTYFQPARGEPRVVIYRNGIRTGRLSSFMDFFPTAIPAGEEARYVIYAFERDPLVPGSGRWWLIWTPDGPTKMELVGGRPVCQGYRTGYGWEEVKNPAVHGPWTPERVYRSGDWQAELLPESFTFPGFDPYDLGQSPPKELPPELDPWRR